MRRSRPAMLAIAVVVCSFAPGFTPADLRPPERRVLFFGASWCGACRNVKQAEYPRLKEKHWKIGPALSDHIQEIDVDQKPELTAKYGIQSMPTFILLVDGKEVERHGPLTAYQIAELYYGRLGKEQQVAGR